MSVVVGYVPTREGETALDHAVGEARSRGARLVVVNTSRGDALVDERYVDDDQLATLRAKLADSGVDHELVHTMRGRDASEEILAVAEERRAQLVLIGLRRRSPSASSCSAPPLNASCSTPPARCSRSRSDSR